MNEAIHSIHLRLAALEAQAHGQRETIAALRDEVKRLTADVARQMYKRAPLPATRTGRCGDDR